MPPDEPEPTDNPMEEAQEGGDDQGTGLRSDGEKVPQGLVNYSDSPAACQNCIHYVDDSTCGIVAGTITPTGHCNLFETMQDHEGSESPEEEAQEQAQSPEGEPELEGEMPA